MTKMSIPDCQLKGYHFIQTVFKDDKKKADACLHVLEYVVLKKQKDKTPICSQILNLITPMTECIIGYKGNECEEHLSPEQINERICDRVKLWLEFSLVEANLDSNHISCLEGILERFGTTSVMKLSDVSDAFFKANSSFVASGATMIPWRNIVIEKKELFLSKLKGVKIDVNEHFEIIGEEEKEIFTKACIDTVLESNKEELYRTIDNTPYLSTNDKTKLKYRAYIDLLNHDKTLNYINQNYEYIRLGDCDLVAECFPHSQV
jgi:hypothetical protein